ncbi:hypothetical protein AJ80_09428 [Polytolypa hystricis UAMH7299]|uniref:Integral membrane protein n=1 Tax=Polytolypa hystricis (strain UAMH7299) TaxID=1447883 RepID=A0A2B7WHY6_POLH7|nr:hypothetical protein AJ80_09428 [Polytolypa hystricis UAMH7299]
MSPTFQAMPIRSALHTLALTAVALLLCVIYGKTHFYRDPGSAFYDPNRAFERRYSLHREGEAQNYIDDRVGGSGARDATTKAGVEPRVCAAFSTVKRESVQYIETAVGSVLHGLTEPERADLFLTVFFANINASVHPTWEQPWLRPLADDAYTYDDVPGSELSHLRTLEETRNFAEKGVFDYTYALQHCYDVGTPYVAMFENDTHFAHGWFVRALLALREIEAITTTTTSDNDENNGNVKSWLYMRLFNQERSTGWANRNVFGNNEHWIILAFASVILLPALFIRRRSPRRHTAATAAAASFHQFYHRHLGVLVVLALVTIPSFTILFFQSGKASLLPPAPGVFREAFGCCSQAMVFPRESVPGVIEFLRERREGQVDLLLDRYARESGLDTYALYPVQVQHVGSQSVRGTAVKEAQAVWSMAFENLKPATLRKEHLDMVSRFYGQ